MRSARLLQNELLRTYEVMNADEDEIIRFIAVIVSPGSVNTAVEPLRIGRKLDRYRKTARMVLEPWTVEKALERLGDRRISDEEQRIVVKATRTPEKVNWPEWWSLRKP